MFQKITKIQEGKYDLEGKTYVSIDKYKFNWMLTMRIVPNPVSNHSHCHGFSREARGVFRRGSL